MVESKADFAKEDAERQKADNEIGAGWEDKALLEAVDRKFYAAHPECKNGKAKPLPEICQ